MASVEIGPGLHLDGRLALFHGGERWLAVADTHYGYSEAMCRAGGLFPLWGNGTLISRLEALCRDYQPRTLVIAGDLVHGRISRDACAGFVDHLRLLAPELVLIRGNHDRHASLGSAPLVDSWRSASCFFHHGHLALTPPPDAVEVIGHWHPAISLRDGAGLALKLPAFIQEARRWVLPAFSPWAGGMPWKTASGTAARRWICSPQRLTELAPA